MSDRSQPARQVIQTPFESLEEWGQWLHTVAAPPRADDLPVIAGQPAGPRRRATHDELQALLGDVDELDGR